MPENPGLPIEPVAAPVPDVWPGSGSLTGELVLERYRLLRRLGSGGMGKVYEAEHVHLGTRHAVKALSPSGGLPEDHRDMIEARFLREAKICATVCHPNLVSVTDFGAAGGIPYIVMDFIDGEDLGKIIQKGGGLGEEASLRIVRDVASAVAALHENGILHRDLKPPNIMIELSTGRVVLTDLGIAKDLTGHSAHATLGVLGTPSFMAPEQMVDSSGTSFESDVYSLGATFFTMLTARAPFKADTSIALMVKARDDLMACGSLAAVSRQRDGFQPSQQVYALLDGMTRYERQERFASCAEIVDRAASILGERTPVGKHGGRKRSTNEENRELVRRTLGVEAEGRAPSKVRPARRPVGEVRAEAPRRAAPVSPPPERAEGRGRSGQHAGVALEALAKGSAPPGAAPRSGRGNVAMWSMAAVVVLGLGWLGYRKLVSVGGDSPVAPHSVAASDLPAALEVPLPPARPLELVLVPSGGFTIGSDDAANLDESPARKVAIARPFYVGRYEITVGQFVSFLNESRVSAAGLGVSPAGIERGPGGWRPAAGADRLPVRGISHALARHFCRWILEKTGLVVELPGEVEWEYAARGPDSRVYPWGDEWEEGRSCAGGMGAPSEVGSYPMGRSWCGAEDMCGNVFEWCADRYVRGRYRRLSREDPPVPGAGSSDGLRVVRGGCFANPKELCRAAYRNALNGAASDAALGFRVKARAAGGVQRYAAKVEAR